MSRGDSFPIIEHHGLRSPGTFTPATGSGPRPAVLLLHGTASHRDEVGDLFRRLADSLAAEGVSSLRIDFAGCGESDRPQTDFTVTSELDDARAAFDWLSSHPDVDPNRISVLGFSQGGMIALLLASSTPTAAGLITWSSGLIPVTTRTELFAPLFEAGSDSGIADFGFAQFHFTRVWWDEFRSADLEAAAREIDVPVLAIAGSEDEIVPPRSSFQLIDSTASADRTLIQLPGVDHIFNSLDTDDRNASELVLRTTVDWVRTRAHRSAAQERAHA